MKVGDYKKINDRCQRTLESYGKQSQETQPCRVLGVAYTNMHSDESRKSLNNVELVIVNATYWVEYTQENEGISNGMKVCASNCGAKKSNSKLRQRASTRVG